jgi:uncharacterized protein YgiM (DUF1202 family)
MATQNSFLRSRFAAKLLLPAALGMTLLASCGLLSKPSAKAPAKDKDAAATTAAGEFKFPQATCGEEASTPSENWYPVYIDGAELSAIRSQYCGNAISEVRSKTGAPTVQVASFTSYEKAKAFASAVGGEVGVVGSAPATTSTGSGSSQALATGRTATLNSAEKGSPINIRQSASTDASVQEVAYSGDSIKVSSKTEGTDGYTWYKVELNSGASGWVRSDLISSASDTAGTATRTATRSSEDAAATATRTEDSTRDAASANSPSANSPSANSTASTSPRESSRDSSTIAAAPPASSAPSSSSSASTITEAPAATRTSSSASGRTATIATRDPDSPINVRSGAGTSSEVQDVAYGGDRIEITDTQQGDDGQTWYKVQFESGATGWVRSDFVGN